MYYVEHINKKGESVWHDENFRDKEQAFKCCKFLNYQSKTNYYVIEIKSKNDVSPELKDQFKLWQMRARARHQL